MTVRPDREALHQFLDLLLDSTEALSRPGSSGEAQQRALANVLGFVPMILGADFYKRAMKSGEDGEGLLLLANRFAQLRPLFDGLAWPDGLSFDAIMFDLFAISYGDKPLVLQKPGIRGKKSNAHALLERKLQALAWLNVLRSFGCKAYEAEAVVASAFNISPKGLASWRDEAEAKLDPEYVHAFLADAELIYSSRCLTRDAAEQGAKAAGLEYRKVLLGA